jgi:hypothetical protein
MLPEERKYMAKSTSTTKTRPTSINETETIHVGKLNGGYVILVQEEWNQVQERLERAGYKLNFRVERLMHGTSEGDVTPGLARAAGSSA